MEATQINWSPLWSLSDLIPWLVLLLLLRRPANRGTKAWRFLVPLFVLEVLLFGGAHGLVPLVVSQRWGPLADCFYLLAFAAAMLWLIMDKVASSSRLRAMLLVVFVLILAMAWAPMRMGTSGFVISRGPLLAVQALTLAGGLLLAARRSRRCFTPWRYACWLLPMMMIAGIAATGLLIVVLLMAYEGMQWESAHLLAVLAMGSRAGVGGFALMLPFLVLTFRQPVWRARFLAALRLNEVDGPDALVYSDNSVVAEKGEGI